MVLFPTGLPLLKDIELPKSSEQIKCEADGGTWDNNTKTCTLPTPEPEPAPAPEQPAPDVKLTTPEFIRDEETGEISGVTLPDGKTFFGTPKEVREITEASQRRTTPPAGTVPLGTARTILEETKRKIRLAGTVGQIDFELASQLEEQGINIREVVFAGIQGVDLERAGLAGIGAAVAVGVVSGPAVPVTAPAAAGIVAGSTLVLDFFNDVRKNIKAQRQDLVTVKTKELRQRKTAMNNYIQAANMNPAEADDYVLAYNIEKSLIRRDFNTLVKRGNEDLEFWGTDATPQITEYEVFFESVQPSLDVRMEQAVLKPEPTRAFLSIGDEEE